MSSSFHNDQDEVFRCERCKKTKFILLKRKRKIKGKDFEQIRCEGCGEIYLVGIEEIDDRESVS